MTTQPGKPKRWQIRLSTLLVWVSTICVGFALLATPAALLGIACLVLSLGALIGFLVGGDFASGAVGVGVAALLVIGLLAPVVWDMILEDFWP